MRTFSGPQILAYFIVPIFAVLLTSVFSLWLALRLRHRRRAASTSQPDHDTEQAQPGNASASNTAPAAGAAENPNPEALNDLFTEFYGTHEDGRGMEMTPSTRKVEEGSGRGGQGKGKDKRRLGNTTTIEAGPPRWG